MFCSSYGVLPFLFVVLLVCSSGIGVVYAQGDLSKHIELFTSATKVSTGAQGSNDTDKGDVEAFYPLSLLNVNDLMVGLAIAYYDEVEDADNGVWARHISSEGKDWAAQTTAESGKKWTTQVAIQRRKKTDYTVQLSGPKAVVKENKVFLLLQRDDKPNNNQNQDEWDVELYTGDVTASPGGGGKAIKFGSPTSLKNTVDAYLKTKSWSRPRGATGRGILMKEENTIVFPLVAVKGEGNDKKHFCTVIYSTDNGKSWRIPSSGFIDGNCFDADLFEWEGKLLMFASRGDEENKLYESSDMGETWADLSKTRPTVLSEGLRFGLGNAQYDIMTITIDNKDMVLFTKKGSYEGQASSTALHLLLSDNNRVYSVGPISDDYVFVDAFIDLLYTKDELFAMYDGGSYSNRVIVFSHLPRQLERIKTVVKTWKEVDKKVSERCSFTDVREATVNNLCSTPMPINGLFGLLSDKGNTTKWEDEYLGVGATVQGSATKVNYGLKLALPGTQVVWPIGEQGDNQAYSFTDRGFTVVATVTIHNKPQSVTRLMGVELGNGDSNGGYTGLSYDKDKQWKGVTVGGGSGEPNTWEEGKAYQVALVFEDGTGSAYIDGKLLGRLEDPVVPAAPNANGAQGLPSGGYGQMLPQPSQVRAGESLPPRDVSKIYLGESENNQGGTSSEVTVRNVMSYARPLNTSELQMPINNNNTNTNTTNNKNTKNNNNNNNNTTNNNDTNSNTDSNNKNKKNNNKGDNSMYEHVSCLLLVLMGLLGFVTLC